MDIEGIRTNVIYKVKHSEGMRDDSWRLEGQVAYDDVGQAERFTPIMVI